MGTKIKLREVRVGRNFPATWEGEFTKQPVTGQVEAKKAIIQRIMNDDKRRQVRSGQCSPGFKLLFDWVRIKEEPVTYTLTITLGRDGRFEDGDGQETPPQPKSPVPPPQ